MMNIAAQIPPRARRVAELGSLRERAGEAFLRIQPEAEYIGVSEDGAEAEAAAGFLSRAFCAGPESLDMAALGIRQVDVLIVRERFTQGLTAERLGKWCQALKEDGQLFLELPNAFYIRTYLEQLAGQATWRGAAPSVAEVRELLQAAGLQLLQVQGVFASEQDGELRRSEENAALLGALQALLGKLGWQADRERDPWMKGFFFKAAKKAPAPEERLLVQAVLGEALVTSRIRVMEPGHFLQTEPGVTFAQVTEQNAMAAQKMADMFSRKIFIRQRLTYLTAEQASANIGSLRKMGCLILGEMDDNPQGFKWRAEKDVTALSYIGTHAMQVSTEPLAELIREYNPCVQVFRNELAELPVRRDYEEERRARGQEDHVTFFFGALNRKEEWQQVMPVLNELAAKYGAGLRFKVISDRGFYEALQTPYKEFIGDERLYGGEFVPYDVYQKVLHGSDISFLPLRDTAFNRMKSDLKFIESAAHGAVALASPTVYEATMREGETGFFYRSPSEFREKLAALIENRELRLKVAQQAYEYVKRERLLSSHYLERLEWYRELVSRRQELDAALMGRLREWQAKHPGISL